MTDTPLVLLHGALGGAATFDALRSRLGDASVLALDLPGHGTRAAERDALSMDRFVDDLRAALDARGIERARFFGYSMGGYVALLLALRHPERVARVTTLATKLAWSPETAARETRFLDPDAIRAKVPRFAATLAARHGEAHWPDLCRRTAALLVSLGAHPPLDAERLATITVPVRLAVGDRDATVTLDETIAAYRAIPGAELAVLPGTGHAFESTDVGRVVGVIEG